MLRTPLISLALVVSSLAVVPGSAPAAAPARGTEHELQVVGFAYPSLSHRNLRRDAPALSTLAIDGLALDADGRGTADTTTGMVRLAGVADGLGLHTELMLHNYSNDLGDFDERRAHRLLSSPEAIAAVAEQLVDEVADGGFGGVDIDLELIRRGDADGLVALAEALQDAMPADATVTICISGSTSVTSYRDRGYRLTALARAVDRIELMAYDQHGPTWSKPGPIGGLGWQRDVVAAMLTKVSAEQVDLGVAGYGYTWPREGTGRTIKPGGAREAVEKAGAKAVWHPRSGEWSARLPNGTVMWWSDARSYRKRYALATELGVHGLALWRLGSADPLR